MALHEGCYFAERGHFKNSKKVRRKFCPEVKFRSAWQISRRGTAASCRTRYSTILKILRRIILKRTAIARKTDHMPARRDRQRFLEPLRGAVNRELTREPGAGDAQLGWLSEARPHAHLQSDLPRLGRQVV